MEKLFDRLDWRKLMQKLESALGKHTPIVTIIRDIYGYFLLMEEYLFFPFFQLLVLVYLLLCPGGGGESEM
jgi:hypothetical protein